MKNSAAVARPYARAIFTLANGANTLPQWQGALEGLVDIVTNDDMRPLLSSPQFSADALYALIIKIAENDLSFSEVNRFIRLLCDSDRLAYIPAILAEFNTLKNIAQQSIEVFVEAAEPLGDEGTQRLTEKLKKRFNRNIILSVELKQELIAGVRIYAEGQVIDGSLLGRLNRLTEKLTNEAR